jgi:hypothetical protein
LARRGQPFTTTVDAMRALWIGDPAGNDIAGAVESSAISR